MKILLLASLAGFAYFVWQTIQSFVDAATYDLFAFEDFDESDDE